MADCLEIDAGSWMSSRPAAPFVGSGNNEDPHIDKTRMGPKRNEDAHITYVSVGG